jgi:hypothetical protein
MSGRKGTSALAAHSLAPINNGIAQPARLALIPTGRPRGIALGAGDQLDRVQFGAFIGTAIAGVLVAPRSDSSIGFAMP